MSENPWLQTWSGDAFDLVEPTVESVHLVDIVMALSKLNRYCGHTRRLYSVLEHSALVARALYVETEDHVLAAHGLLHDAHEIFTNDLPSPVKRVIGKPWYDFEARIEAVVQTALFGEAKPPDPRIKDMDHRILLPERERLMSSPPKPWWGGGDPPMRPPCAVLPKGLDHIDACGLFWRTFRTLRVRSLLVDTPSLWVGINMGVTGEK